MLPRAQASLTSSQLLQEMPFFVFAEQSASPGEDMFVKNKDLAAESINPESRQVERADLYWDAFKGHPDRLAQHVRERHQPQIEQWKQNRELAALTEWMKTHLPEVFEFWEQNEPSTELMPWLEQNLPDQLQEWKQQHREEELKDWKQTWKETANQRELGPWLHEHHQNIIVQYMRQDPKKLFNQWKQKEHLKMLQQWGGRYPAAYRLDENRLKQVWEQGGQQAMFVGWLKEKHPNVFQQWEDSLEKWLEENPQAVLARSAAEHDERILREWATQSRQNIDANLVNAGRLSGPDAWLEIDDPDHSELVALDEGFKQEVLRQQFEKIPFGKRNIAFLAYCDDGKWANAAAILGAGGVDLNQGERDEESIPEETGTTALMRAVTSKNCIQIMRGLLAEGADVNQKDALLGETALFYAILAGQDEVVDFLIQNKADVNVANILGTTPLMVAVGLGREKMVRALIQGGADVNAKKHRTLPVDEALDHPAFDTQNGETALMRAAKSRNPEVIKILIDAGATMGVIATDVESVPNQEVKVLHNPTTGTAGHKKRVWSQMGAMTPASPEQEESLPKQSNACLPVYECMIQPFKFLWMGFRACVGKLQKMDQRTNSDSTHMSGDSYIRQPGLELSDI